MIIKPCILSIISLVCGIYLAAAMGIRECEEGSTDLAWIQKLFAGIVLLLLLAINCLSVKLATRVQIVFTATKLLAMIVIVIIGMVKMIQGNTEHLSTSTAFEGTSSRFFSYSIAIYQGHWAYDSWNQLNFITEELKNPSR
ncbi:putative b(0,+)-type amino acid transporter 1 isoform X4 [Apostichopus japonicus]|uniref:Putative b(0,+)-type amino acid transporter 1 isoform X4 n=2 Tax=Stichopus japonicus TaxID=307972 RepID=A0A2G8K6U6_STIJA|nr:putative b(0,+)-type amino acid transporter 1 isoform X4 [Apostichopus japonicus]